MPDMTPASPLRPFSPATGPRNTAVVTRGAHRFGRGTIRRRFGVGAALALVVASCGGSDSGGSGALPGDDERDIGEQVLEDYGIDVNDTESADDALEILQGDASDALDELSNATGAATIIIDGASYRVDAGSCFNFDGNINFSGAGVTPDGEAFWSQIDYTIEDRAEMAESELFDEAFLDQMFGELEQIVDVSVTVEVGKSDRFEQAGDGFPEFSAQTLMGSPLFGDLTFDTDGSTVSGSGDITDENGVAVGYSELLPFEFTATCS